LKNRDQIVEKHNNQGAGQNGGSHRENGEKGANFHLRIQTESQKSTKWDKKGDAK